MFYDPIINANFYQKNGRLFSIDQENTMSAHRINSIDHVVSDSILFFFINSSNYVYTILLKKAMMRQKSTIRNV